jgi:hypothetical protein
MHQEFSGETYNENLDGQRLRTQLGRVLMVMMDGDWHTLAELSERCEGSEAAISARLRDLRKDKHGSWTVSRMRVSGGLHKYRLDVGVEG